MLRFGKSDVQSPFESMPFGFDGVPKKDLRAVYASTQERGVNVIVGYINVNQIAEEGEVRLYSLDVNSDLSTYIHLKNDNTMEVGGDDDNMVRYSKLEEAFNDLKKEHDDLVDAFNQHQHAALNAIPVPIPSIIPVVNSQADITPAKIETIKTLQ